MIWQYPTDLKVMLSYYLKAELVPMFLHQLCLVLKPPETFDFEASLVEVETLHLQVHQPPPAFLVFLQLLSRKCTQLTP